MQTALIVVTCVGKKYGVVQEYLSPSKGVGLQYCGFFNLEPNASKTLSTVDYSASNALFGSGRNLMWFDIRDIQPQLTWINDARLDSNIVPQKDKLYAARLGTLMADPNNSEVNFIGDATVVAWCVDPATCNGKKLLVWQKQAECCRSAVYFNHIECTGECCKVQHN